MYYTKNLANSNALMVQYLLGGGGGFVIIYLQFHISRLGLIAGLEIRFFLLKPFGLVKKYFHLLANKFTCP